MRLQWPLPAFTKKLTLIQRTYREAYAWAQIAKSPIQCENINTFRGVLFIDLSDVVLGVVDVTIPAIVTDYIRYDSIEYTCQRNPDQRLDIVSTTLRAGAERADLFLAGSTIGKRSVTHALSEHGSRRPEART